MVANKSQSLGFHETALDQLLTYRTSILQELLKNPGHATRATSRSVDCSLLMASKLLVHFDRESQDSIRVENASLRSSNYSGCEVFKILSLLRSLLLIII